MSSTLQSLLDSWSFDLGISTGLILAAILYLRGWRVLRRVAPNRFPAWRLWAFLAGLAALLAALESPLDTFSGLLLSAHMVQHLILMSVAPPLILLGAPLLPLLRGLPRAFARDGLGPFLVWPPLRRFGWALTHPVVGWLALVVSLCAWHIPAAFELALRSPAWHKVEHACFLGCALLFWWPVIRPFPTRPHWPLWSVPLYLLAADIMNTALCAFLTFTDRVLYPAYENVPRLFGTTALSDQVAAGVLMWVPGSLVFLIPATVIAIQYLSSGQKLVLPRTREGRAGSPLHAADSTYTPTALSHRRTATRKELPARRPFDLLSMPIVGRFLRSLSGRRMLQATLLLIAIAVMADGFFGQQGSSTNLASVAPWTWWRGLTVVALLAIGNVFCMACPFMLPRELGRRLGHKQRAWPRALRSKWLAVGLLLIFFWAYEAFGLWHKPMWTAWLILGYFAAAFIVDAFFRGASFCKFVCPIGQFQFINSLVSPLEVKVRNPDVCAGCRTHDCLGGNQTHRGCETELHLPAKSGNLDCTFCLDCVRACPHDNIGLLAVVPGADLARDPQRASLGRFSRRPDLAALALVLVFAAFAGAAAMAGPVAAWLDRLKSEMQLTSPGPVVAFFFFITLVLAPALALGAAVLAGRGPVPLSASTRELFCRLSLALVPLGAAMWAAHFLFHLLTGYGDAWPVLQPDSLLVFQTLLLDGGLLLSLYVGWRVARDCAPRLRSALRLLAPWACVALALYATGIWICLQPMQMRGMMDATL